MPILNIHPTIKSNIATQIMAPLDAGAGPALIKFYTGAIPANLGAITSQVLLGTLTCSDPAASYSGNTITFAPVTQDNAADASGTATWARITDSDGNALYDVDVTAVAGTGTIKLNTVDIVAGGPILLNSFVINLGTGS